MPTPDAAALGGRAWLGDFARYGIGKELGRGGMGTVFRAWDFDLDRAVALKVLNEVIEDDERFAARFIREARVAARLQHPAIVPVYDVGRNPEGKLYFTMRLVDGTTLGEVVRRAARRRRGLARVHALPPARDVPGDFCTAIAYVHEHGIVHRDLKPDNVMLGAYGEVLVMDWGIAKALSDAGRPEDDEVSAAPAGALAVARAHTVAGAVMGTPAFMAPEQARGEAVVTPLWDVYALGAILHYLLTGRVPERATAVRGRPVEETLVPPRTLDPTLPPELDAICMRALAREPEARYPSAKALADDVQALLEQRPVSAFREGALRRAWKWARRHKRPLAGVFAVLLLAASAAFASRAVAARAAREVARAHARGAAETFRSARAELPKGPRDPAAIRAARDRVLGLGMTALEAAEALRALAPAEEMARRGAFDAALSLGEVAIEEEQWGLAASAFERARDAHVDDARAAGAIASVEEARTRKAEERKATVARVVGEARRGALERDEDYHDALFTLVAAGDAVTVGMLAAALDRVTQDLQAAERAFLTGAEGKPERARVAAAQERAVGAGSLRLARLASEALGRIGIADGAVDPLERYLAAEEDAAPRRPTRARAVQARAPLLRARADNRARPARHGQRGLLGAGRALHPPLPRRRGPRAHDRGGVPRARAEAREEGRRRRRHPRRDAGHRARAEPREGLRPAGLRAPPRWGSARGDRRLRPRD